MPRSSRARFSPPSLEQLPRVPGDRATIAQVPLRRVAIVGAILLASASGLAVAATHYPYGRGTGGCPLFPASNPWREKVAALPLSPRSSAYIATIGASLHLHPDFGSNLTYGIPYVVVPARQPKVAIHFTAYGSQSDKGPYPVPAGAPVEGGAGSSGDRHVLVVQAGACKLYELFAAQPNADGSWSAGSGAVFDLRSNRLRPNGWTSADAAGLPIFPGLVRYDEVVGQQVIRHALRFTVRRTRRAYVAPARHYASRSDDPALPPMGMRVRLKASYDISGYPPSARVILQALKTYGMILADNGSDWFLSGALDARWDDDALNTLKRVTGNDLEVVQMGPMTTHD